MLKYMELFANLLHKLKAKKEKGRWKDMNPSDDYKLTDLDYLIGDHHLQMIKAALPYLGVPAQKTISLFVKAQELRKTVELFETEEVASMGICSLESSERTGSVRDLLQAVRPYGNPMEQDMIDMAQTLMEGQTPMEQLRRFLTPEQQSRFETMEMIMTAMQAMS